MNNVICSPFLGKSKGYNSYTHIHYHSFFYKTNFLQTDTFFQNTFRIKKYSRLGAFQNFHVSEFVMILIIGIILQAT